MTISDSAFLNSISIEIFANDIELLKRIIDLSPAGIVILDEGGKVKFANEIAQKVLDLTLNKKTQSPHDDPRWQIESTDRHESRNQVLPFQILRRKLQPIFGLQHAIVQESGKRIILNINAVPILDQNTKFKGIIATVEDITESVLAKEELTRLNRALKAINECKLYSLNVKDERMFLQKICQILVTTGGYELAWVGFIKKEEMKIVEPVAQAGLDDGYVKSVQIKWDVSPLGQGPTGRAIRTHLPAICQDIATDSNYQPWREEALKRGFHSSIALPLMNEGNIIGSLNIYAHVKDAFNEDEAQILIGFASDVASGINVIRTAAEREDTLQKLHTNEAFLSDIFKSIQDGISVLDSNFTILQVNPIMKMWFEYNLPLEWKKCYEAYYLRTEPCQKCPTQNTDKNKIVGIETLPKKDKSGNQIGWYEVFSFPFYDIKTQVFKGVIEYIRDITEQIKVEKERELTEEKYRTLFKENVAIVTITNYDGSFYDVNPAWHRLTGYTPDEMKDLRTQNIYVDAKDRDVVFTLLKQNKAIENFEAQFKIKNDRRIWMNFSVTNIFLGGQMRVLTTGIDITQKKETEAVMRRLQKETIRTAEIRSNLITFAAHNLKTPLIPILGWTDVALNALDHRRPLNDVLTKENILTIQNAARKIEQIINDFIDLEKLEKNKMVLHKQQHSTLMVAQNAVKGILPIARTHQIDIINQVSDEHIYLDSIRIEQVLVNLLTNAIKFSPSQTTVKISSTRSEKTYTFIIEDQGFGFSQEDMLDLWYPFSRSYESNKERGSASGSGIGLILSKTLVEQHGGTININSEGRSKGTIVKVTLPLFEPIQLLHVNALE